MNTYYTEIQKCQAKQNREIYFNRGRTQAKQNDPLHIKGCMLYWAEGTKSRNTFGFSNCEVETHKLMVSFLKRFFGDHFHKLKVRVNFYPSKTNSYESVQKFWCDQLGIELHQFNKYTDRSKYYTAPKVNKYPNGILLLRLGSNQVVQHIFGAINEYVGSDLYNVDSFRK
jgi:hypothetical protein